MCSELEQKEKELEEVSVKDVLKFVHNESTVGIAAKLAQQKLDLDNNSVLQKCSIDFSIYEKLEVFLSSHVQLALSPILRDGRPIHFSDFAVPSEGWSCRRCEHAGNFETSFQCAKCRSLRGVETLPNLLYSPEQVTEEEVEVFKSRRAFEKQMICARDLITPDMFKTDGSWYLISAEWLKMWKAYIFNKPTKRSAVNKAVGVLPPGPICNERLVLPDGKTPRQGLEKVRDILRVERGLQRSKRVRVGGVLEDLRGRSGDSETQSGHLLRARQLPHGRTCSRPPVLQRPRNNSRRPA